LSLIGESLVLFPTVAHHDATTETWLADVHGWCFNSVEEVQFQRARAAILRRTLKLDRKVPDPPYFRERALGFVVDNRKKIVVEIADRETVKLAVKSKRNGHFKSALNLAPPVEEFCTQTPFGSLKTSLSALRTDCDLKAAGDVYLIPPTGLSVISDIDDTIKFSNVADKSELLANTFLRPFRPIEGMAEVFQKLAARDSSFHYISATPWQMIATVSRFLGEHGFPEGSIHLRKFALKDVTFLKKIFPAHKKKRKVIENLMERFPDRRFLLFGDTGEKDPEMYGEIARRYPDQVLGICVRNVTPDPPDSLRYRRAFAQVPTKKWTVFEDAMRLESIVLPELLGRTLP